MTKKQEKDAAIKKLLFCLSIKDLWSAEQFGTTVDERLVDNNKKLLLLMEQYLNELLAYTKK